MSRRGKSDDIPLDIEIVDSAGTVIAGGSGALEPADQAVAEPEPSARRSVPVRGVAIVAIGAVLAVVAALVIRGDDDPPAVTLGPGLGILDDGDASLSLSRTTPEATFPLFGRSWDHQLIGMREGRLEALDLNTGEEIDLGRDDTPFSFTQRVIVVDGAIFSVTNDAVYRHFPGRAELVSDRDDNDDDPFGRGIGVTGNYWFFADTRNNIVLNHLRTTRTVEIGNVIDYAAVGDDIFVQLGGRIVRLDAEGTESSWADGEILAVGAANVAWRNCAALDDCRYWIGTAENARGVELPSDIAATALVDGLFNAAFAPGLFTSIDLLFPAGRTLLQLDTGERDLELDMVDLMSGATLEIPVWRDVIPSLSPDESLLIARGEGAGVIAIDTSTGEELTLPTSLEPAGFSYAFAPIE